MRRLNIAAPFLTVLFASSALIDVSTAEAADPVTMYGASWCGPCKSLRAFFQKAGIAYTYKDVDDPKNFAAFESAARGKGGIPLTLVGKKTIRGYAPQAILQALGKAKQKAPAARGELYGDKPATEWQREFRGLRAYVQKLEQKVAHLEKVAVDHVEKELLTNSKRSLKLARASLNQLDADASRVSLPRSFRR